MTGISEALTIFLVAVFTLIPYGIAAFALWKLLVISRDIKEVKMLVAALKETVDRTGQ